MTGTTLVCDSPPDHEGVLIKRILNGESGLFPELLREHERFLRRQVDRIVKNPADTDDVIQETKWKAFKNLARFRGESSFRSWLLAIGINEARMLYRYRERSRCVPFEEYSSNGALSDAAPSKVTVLDRLCREQDSRALDTVIRMLPAHFKAVIEVRFRLDASLEEAAQLLDLTVGAVKCRQHRAIQMMKVFLNMKGREPREASIRAAERVVAPNGKNTFVIGSRRRRTG
jgi:RNA polymerase sigma factor (sigma-70 family)